MTGRPRAEAIRISVAAIANPPSPTRAITGRPGRVSLAAIAAGTPNPIADSPLGISTERGPAACHTWPAMILCEPTSVVTMASRGAASLAIATTSEGLSLPSTRPASQAARSRARCAATSAPAHRGSPDHCAQSQPRMAATWPTSSCALA